MAEADKKNYITQAEASSQGCSGTGNVSGMGKEKTSAVCEPAGSYYVELAKHYAEISKQYAEEYAIDMDWFPISQEDWVLDNGRYKTELENPISVIGVFQGSETQKTLVVVNITITDEKTIIHSYNPFDGFVLGLYSISES